MINNMLQIPLDAIELGRAYLPIIREANELLFKHFKIFLLTYRRFFFNGKMLYLFGHEEWMETCFRQYYMTSHSFVKRWQEMLYYPEHQFIFPPHLKDSQNSQDPIYNDLQQRGLWHGAIIYKNRADCLDAYCFITESNNALVRDIYHNYAEIIDEFINDLMIKITPLLKKSSEPYLIPFNLPQKDLHNKMQEEILSYKRELNNSKHYLRLNQQDILLSRQQYECFTLQGFGLTQKQIAQELGINYRSVETHLERIRKKAKINFNSELKTEWYNQKSYTTK